MPGRDDSAVDADMSSGLVEKRFAASEKSWKLYTLGVRGDSRDGQRQRRAGSCTLWGCAVTVEMVSVR